MLALSLVPPDVSPVQFLLLGGLSVLVMGAAKGGFSGLGILCTPMMVYACGGDSRLAMAIVLPLLIACDYVTMVIWWRQWDSRNVLMLVPGMVLGIALGGVALWRLNQLGGSDVAGGRAVASAGLSLAIGLLALGFASFHALKAIRGRLGQKFRPVFWHAMVAGSTAGFTSTLSHAAGPITMMYLLPQKMAKGRFVATTVLYYWIGNQVKLVPYFLLGMLNTTSLSSTVAFVPVVVGGSLLGAFLHNKINETWFGIIVHSMLAAMGLHLTVTSAMALAG